ncbi:c-type cytochrome, partial [Candidatus Poribacteria bacterium]|nr:c-type cytochrome [Candidatus Poribacteria bacterium]
MKQFNNTSILILVATLLLFSSLIAISAFAQDKKAPASSEAGKALYEQKCAHCHGIEGKGDGPAAVNLLPKPRDFTKGLYKIRSTASGQLPTEQDIFDIITKGMPGSAMPAWEKILKENERWQLVAYIKTFYSDFKDAKPRGIDLSGKIPYSEESVAKGREIYKKIECHACHGEVGRGDGTSAPDLKDEWGFQTWPANMTQNWNFRGGSTTEDIFKRFVGGIAGSPMPSFISSFRLGLTDAESDRMIALEKKMGESELTAEEQA